MLIERILLNDIIKYIPSITNVIPHLSLNKRGLFVFMDDDLPPSLVVMSGHIFLMTCWQECKTVHNTIGVLVLSSLTTISITLDSHNYHHSPFGNCNFYFITVNQITPLTLSLSSSLSRVPCLFTHLTSFMLF